MQQQGQANERGTADTSWAHTPFHRHNTLVFAPNAGLPVYPSWLPTLQCLAGEQADSESRQVAGHIASQIDTQASRQLPLMLLTDYCEEALHMSQVGQSLTRLKICIWLQSGPINAELDMLRLWAWLLHI